MSEEVKSEGEVKNGNGNGWAKWVVGAGFFLTVLAAINGPIVAKENELQKQLDKHEAQPHHYGTAETLAAYGIKFTEVETQFKWFREISDLNDAKLQNEIDDLKKQVEQLRSKK